MPVRTFETRMSRRHRLQIEVGGERVTITCKRVTAGLATLVVEADERVRLTPEHVLAAMARPATKEGA